MRAPIMFDVIGEPKAQPRPRAFARKVGDKMTARVYDAGTAEGWKGLIAEAARHHVPATPLGVAEIQMRFRIRRPKSHYLKSGALKPSAPRRHTQKPDCDNLAKAVVDCLKTLGFFMDDAVIDQMVIVKRWTSGDPPQGAYIRLVDAEEFSDG